MKNSMKLVEEDVDKIVVRTPVRESLGDLSALEKSIERLGLLFPLLVSRENVLLSGARRLQACRNLGMKKVAVLKLDLEASPLTELDIQCDENLCRKPLTTSEVRSEIARKKRFVGKGARGAAAAVLAKFRGRRGGTAAGRKGDA